MGILGNLLTSHEPIGSAHVLITKNKSVTVGYFPALSDAVLQEQDYMDLAALFLAELCWAHTKDKVSPFSMKSGNSSSSDALISTLKDIKHTTRIALAQSDKLGEVSFLSAPEKLESVHSNDSDDGNIALEIMLCQRGDGTVYVDIIHEEDVSLMGEEALLASRAICEFIFRYFEHAIAVQFAKRLQKMVMNYLKPGFLLNRKHILDTALQD